jgi:hypothetical protein
MGQVALCEPSLLQRSQILDPAKGKHDNRESALVHAHAAIFPKLKFLGLTELNFSEGKNPSGILFDVFERGLQQRIAASGAPSKLLRISCCNISTEHANGLQKLAQEIHWDEDEDLIDGSEDFDHYEPCLFYDPGEDFFLGHGTAPRDRDSDGWDD